MTPMTQEKLFCSFFLSFFLPSFLWLECNLILTAVGLERVLNYTMRDFHWLSTASVKSELDENRASVKPALQDQSVNGDVTVCGLQ